MKMSDLKSFNIQAFTGVPVDAGVTEMVVRLSDLPPLRDAKADVPQDHEWVIGYWPHGESIVKYMFRKWYGIGDDCPLVNPPVQWREILR